MADPFAGIGLEVSDEVEIASGESKMFKCNLMVEEDLEKFPQSQRLKAESDLQVRRNLQAAIQTASDDITKLQDQLYLLRFTSGMTKEELIKQTENYVSEMDRLETKLVKLRERQIDAYFKSLELETLRISHVKVSRHMRRNRSMMGPTDPSTVAAYERLRSENIIASGGAPSKFGRRSRQELEESRDKTDLGHTYQKPGKNYSQLTRSTSHDEMYTPASEYVSDLLRMFREWKQEADEGHQLNSELSQLRAALYNLKQRKDLSAENEEDLRIITAKLRALNAL